MAIALDVFQTQRITLVRFERAVTGNPVIDKPDVDDRGFDTPDFGPVVGITEGDTVTIHLRRVKPWMEDTVALHLSSTDTSIVQVTPTGSTALPKTERMEVTLTGVAQAAGGADDTRIGKVQVRVGSETGPILHELHVRVFQLRPLAVTPHFVTIHQKGQPTSTGVVPRFQTNTAEFNQVVQLVKAIWRACGIDFRFQTALNETIGFNAAGIVSNTPFTNADGFSKTEVATLLQSTFKSNTINVYFVNQIGTGNTLGLGFSRSSSVRFKTGQPGIILADRVASGPRFGVIHWANDLAHEAGHFLQLEHVNNAQRPNEREDTYSRQMLMNVFNAMRQRNPHPSPDGNQRPRFDDVDYGTTGGNTHRGCNVMMKKLAKLKLDNECEIARGTINSNKQF